MSNQQWELTYFDVNGLDSPLFLSSAHLPQPRRDPQFQIKHEHIFFNNRIGSILNMSIDSLALKHHRDWYEECELELYEKPIQDMGGIIIGDDLLDEIVEIYRRRQKFLDQQNMNKKPLSMLVHCTMGINRSALACGAILWAETDPILTGLDSRPWATPQEMIKWMRDCQRRNRRTVLLGNSWMEHSLVRWCLKQG